MYQKIIKFSICALVFLLPLFFLPFSFEAFEFNKQYLLFFLVSLAFLAWLAKMILVDKEIRLKKSLLDFFVLAFLLIAALSAVFSVDRGSSLFGFYGRFSNGLIGLLSLGIFYFLLTNNVQARIVADELPATAGKGKPAKINQESAPIGVDSLMRIFIWSVSLVVLLSYFSIFGLWQKIGQLIPLPLVMLQGIFNPIAGTMEGLAVFLGVIVVLLTGMFLTNQLGKSGKIGACFLFLAILGLLTIIDFVSAWLVIALSLFLFLFVALWKRIFREEINKLLLPIALIVLSAFFLLIDVSGVQKIILGDYLSREQILDQGTSWQVGLRAATENIKSGFLGSGIGTFHYGFAKFKPAEFNQSDFWHIRFDRSRSHFAEILGTMGPLGLFSYLALVGVFLLTSYFFLRQNKNGIALLMAFLALLIAQLVFYQNTVLAFTFWFLLALSVTIWQKPLKEKVISFKDFPELSLVFSTLLVVLVLVFAGMYFFAIRFYLADFNYRSYFETGNERQLARAAEFNPYQSQYKIVLARDYLNKIIVEGQKPIEEIDEVALSNNIYLAIDVAREAVELSPNRVASWEALAMVYREIRGAVTGAAEWGIKSFEKAIELEPINPALYVELGKLYFFSEENDKAREKFNKAKELMSDYVDASIQLALMHEAEDNIEEAIKQMEELASFYPYNVEAIFQLGRLYLNNNQADKAISQLERAVEFFPDYSNALYSLGMAYQAKGEKEKAIAVFEKVLELNPGSEDVIQKLAELKKTKIEKAEEAGEAEEE